jgi:hypothetical protein
MIQRLYQVVIKSAINGNKGNRHSGSIFPFIISAFSVFSVAMITNQYYIPKQYLVDPTTQPHRTAEENRVNA